MTKEKLYEELSKIGNDHLDTLHKYIKGLSSNHYIKFIEEIKDENTIEFKVGLRQVRLKFAISIKKEVCEFTSYDMVKTEVIENNNRRISYAENAKPELDFSIDVYRVIDFKNEPKIGYKIFDRANDAPPQKRMVGYPEEYLFYLEYTFENF